MMMKDLYGERIQFDKATQVTSHVLDSEARININGLGHAFFVLLCHSFN